MQMQAFTATAKLRIWLNTADRAVTPSSLLLFIIEHNTCFRLFLGFWH